MAAGEGDDLIERPARERAEAQTDGAGAPAHAGGRGRAAATGGPAGVAPGTYGLYAIVVLACALGNLSQTAVNAMLPSINADLGASVATSQWLTTGYMLMLGIVVPVATFLSRRLSTRGHVLVGIALSVAGSLADILGGAFPLVLVGRLLQAASCGVLMPLMQTIAMTRFPKGRRATAMGVAGIAMGFAPNVGPTVGGAMDYAWGWRSFFVLMLACSLALGAATLLGVRRGAAPDPRARLELPSLALSTLGFGGVLLGLSQASGHGVASPWFLVPALVGVAFVAAFFVRQRRVQNPLIDLRIFASKRFDGGIVALVLLFLSFMGATLIIPLYVEQLRGGTSLDAGLVILPTVVAALVMNPLAGVLADRVGTRPVVVGASLVMAAGAVSLCLVGDATPLVFVSVAQTVRSVGVSSLIGPLQAWTLAGLEPRLMAHGSSFATLARQAGASFGTALMVLAMSLVADPAAAAAMPALPYQVAFGVSAVAAVALLGYAIARVR